MVYPTSLPADLCPLANDLACSNPVFLDREGVERCVFCRCATEQDNHALECLVMRAQAVCDRHSIEVSGGTASSAQQSRM